MAKPLVSAVIITKNEEENIADCLESVSWAGEIILVDDNSTDKTREIAKKYTDKIFIRKMENEGRHRNRAYAQASNDWILSVDADERVTPELAQEITELLKGRPEYKAYAIPRRNCIGDHWLKYGGEYPAPQTRLFLKDEFRYEEAEVHPRALMEGDTGYLKGDLIHYSHRDIEDYVRSLEGHTTLEAKKWHSSGREMSLGRAVWRAFDRCFYRRLLRKKAYKDGVYGIVVAVFSGMYQILSYAKYWAKKNNLEGLNEKGHPAREDKLPPEGRKKLSVVIIAKNEEDKIRNCLESIKWVDEVVIVDGFSTDKTVEICEEYGAKVIQHRFEGDFGLERNIGNENSSGDWILQLDADEVVTQGFKDKMAEILKDGDEFASYKFLRKNSFFGHFMMRGGWYHYSHHLFKKGFAHYDGKVHHQLIVNGKTGLLKADVEHYPFQTFSQLISRHNRYTTLEAKEIFDLRGRISEKEVLYNIKVKPLKLFWKFYVKKKGFTEGTHGIIFSIFFAWVHFLKWAKYWELLQGKNES